MHPSIAEKLEDIKRLCREHGVKRLEIFGSAARGGDFDPAMSDADFLVEFSDWHKKPWLGVYFDFQSALASLLGREVDLMSIGALEEMRNRFRKRSIERDRELLYAG